MVLVMIFIMGLFKSVVLFVAWNFVFLDMFTIIKPISIFQALCVVFLWIALTLKIKM